MTRILIVEDEVSFSDPLSYLLSKEGYTVSVAENGHDALVEFDSAGADLVLLDLMLPGLSGVDVCRALRQRSNVPVIMLTAKDSEIDKVVGLELGADDYVGSRSRRSSSRRPWRPARCGWTSNAMS
jgi:two-component system response regulator RegX3